MFGGGIKTDFLFFCGWRSDCVDMLSWVEPGGNPFAGRAYTVSEKAKKGTGTYMKLDRNALRRLLSLSDTQLKSIIGKLAASAGVDISGIDLSPAALGELRRAVDNASDEELERMTEQLMGSIGGSGT